MPDSLRGKNRTSCVWKENCKALDLHLNLYSLFLKILALILILMLTAHKSLQMDLEIWLRSGLQNIRYMVIRIHIKHAFHKIKWIVRCILNQRFSVLHGSDHNSNAPLERNRGLICKFPPSLLQLGLHWDRTFFVQNIQSKKNTNVK